MNYADDMSKEQLLSATAIDRYVMEEEAANPEEQTNGEEKSGEEQERAENLNENGETGKMEVEESIPAVENHETVVSVEPKVQESDAVEIGNTTMIQSRKAEEKETMNESMKMEEKRENGVENGEFSLNKSHAEEEKVRHTDEKDEIKQEEVLENQYENNKIESEIEHNVVENKVDHIEVENEIEDNHNEIVNVQQMNGTKVMNNPIEMNDNIRNLVEFLGRQRG